MRSDDEADVVVVGGGPAGSVTAGLLAAAGHQVILVDRAEFPRRKPCGESVNPGAVSELARLGLLAPVRALPHAEIAGWQIHPVTGRGFTGRFGEGLSGIGIDRSAFDSLLLAWAAARGAEVRTGVRVTDVVREGRTVAGVVTAGGGTTRARLVIGADGLRSVIVRRLGALRRMPRVRKIALTAHVAEARLPERSGIVRLTPRGCVGIAPIGGGLANVVVVLSGGSARMAAGDPAGCFDRLTGDVDDLRGAERVGPVLATGPFDWPTRTVATDGALLVGDAAGYFDPLTGQGIYRAIRGARAAAAVADACLRAGRVSRRGLAPYARRHASAFSGGERLQRIIDATVSRPRVFACCAAVLRARPSVADRLIAVTGDVPGRGAPGASAPDRHEIRDGIAAVQHRPT